MPQTVDFSRQWSRRLGEGTVTGEWKPEQLADWELTRRQAELEGRIRTFAPGSASATVLRGELQMVIAEQEDRRKARAGQLAAELERAGADRVPAQYPGGTLARPS
jgi:hypothetical protein